MRLFITADVPQEVRERICAQMNDTFGVVDVHVMELRSLEAPSFATIVAEALSWKTVLGVPATVFLTEIARRSAGDVYDVLKARGVEPLRKVASALARLTRESPAPTHVYIGVPVPDEYFSSRLVIESDDTTKVAEVLARFVVKAQEIEKAVVNEVSGGEEPPGAITLRLLPDGSFIATWEGMNGNQREVHVM